MAKQISNGVKKSIIIGVAITFGLGGLMLWGWNSQTAGVPQNSGAISSLAAAEKFYDFGTISMRNGLVSHVFRITNASAKDVDVRTISTSCMCTSAYIEGAAGEKGPFGMEGMGYVPPADETIKPGESRDIKVVYDPNAHGPAGVGPIDRLVYLTDASGGALRFEIKALVTP